MINCESNLRWIPPHTHTDPKWIDIPVQNQHITQVLDKKEKNSHTKIVVVSLGINHRDNLLESATCSLQALHCKTEEKYPQATIYVPIITFSHNLAAPHQTPLTYGLNAFITTKYNSLFEIHHSEFHTTHNDITTLESRDSLILRGGERDRGRGGEGERGRMGGRERWGREGGEGGWRERESLLQARAVHMGSWGGELPAKACSQKNSSSVNHCSKFIFNNVIVTLTIYSFCRLSDYFVC